MIRRAGLLSELQRQRPAEENAFVSSVLKFCLLVRFLLLLQDREHPFIRLFMSCDTPTSVSQ